MTIVRLGYVAMSTELKNCSPSQTMTYKQFEKYSNKEDAILKLEKIARSNIENCLRLLKHNRANDIRFFRLSSKLVPLATHEALKGWNYIKSIEENLNELGSYVKEHNMRIDFHLDHFVILNSVNKEIFIASLKTLKMHETLLDGMKLSKPHRCVMHIGGKYNDKQLSLERFIENWSLVPPNIQQMIMLENDDKSFTYEDTLYLSEKLGIPLVFDYHHHLANYENKAWQEDWERIANTWKNSPFPIKMHISSPKDEHQFRHHANYIDVHMLLAFLNEIKGSVPIIDCMIEAKMKDRALFQLMEQLKERKEVKLIDGASFEMV